MTTQLDRARALSGSSGMTSPARVGAAFGRSTTRYGTVQSVDSEGYATVSLDGSDETNLRLMTETTPSAGDRATVIHEGGVWKVISLSKVATDAAAGAQAGTDAAAALAEVTQVSSHFWWDPGEIDPGTGELEGQGCRISTEDGKKYGAANALWQSNQLLFRTANVRLLALTSGYEGEDPTTGKPIIDTSKIGLSLYDGGGSSADHMTAYFTGDKVALGRNSEAAHILMCGDTFDIYADQTLGQGYLVADRGVLMRVPEYNADGTVRRFLNNIGTVHDGTAVVESLIAAVEVNAGTRVDIVAATGDMFLAAPSGKVKLNSPELESTASTVTLSSPGAWRSAILSTAFARPSANVSVTTSGDTKLTCATFQTTDSDSFESYNGGIRCKRAGTLRIFASMSFQIATTDAMGTCIVYRNSTSTAYTMSGVSSGSHYGYAGINGWLQTVSAGDVIYLYTNLASAGTISARGSWLSLEFMD